VDAARGADLEIGETAGWETCATGGKLRPFAARSNFSLCTPLVEL